MKSKQTKINYADLWGLREEKYKFLDSYDIENTKWQSLNPADPQNFFVVKDFVNQKLYEQFFPLEKIFKQFNAGVATGKDNVLVDFEKQSLLRKLSINDKSTFETFMENNKVEEELIEKWFDELNKINIEEQIREYNYRPFDNRYVIYSSKILQRARKEIMDNFMRQNIAISVTNSSSQGKYNEVFISDKITDKHLTGQQTYVFPLYLYGEEDGQGMIFDGQEKLDIEGAQHTLRSSENRSSNINWNNLPTFCSTLQSFTSSLTKSFIQPAEAIFYYIYAILYSNIYRKKYQEFLKIDFPRIPFTEDYSLFKSLAQRGEQLVNLHLLGSKELGNPLVKFYGRGDNLVEKREWKNHQAWINDKQYFTSIKEEVWKYYIGGYQVLDKWLKDRKGRILSSEDIKHYCRVATAISETIEIQKEIDKLYPRVEKSFIKS